MFEELENLCFALPDALDIHSINICLYICKEKNAA